jgi:integrase
MRAGRRLPRGIYRRGDVLWIRFKSSDGKLTRETTGQRDVKVAEAILAKRRSEVAMLTHFPKRKFEQLGFKDLLEAWEPAHVKKTPSFSYLLKRVRDEFGGVKAREVTTARVQQFLDRLRDVAGLSASSVNKYRTILNSIFNESVRHGRYDVNPVRAVHQFREPPGRDRFLSIEEFRLLLDSCKNRELRTVILVLCRTTLRLRELLNRRWDEVHLDGPAPFISVPHTKTGVPKKVPLPKVAVEALKALPSYDVDDYVFPSRATTRWRNPARPYRWDMGKEFRTLVRSLGIENLRLHDLRHTGPSVLLMQGIPGDVVRKITGHRSRELERYQHLSPLFRAQTVDLIAQVLFSGTPTGSSDTPTDTPPPGEEDEKSGGPETLGREGDVGGVDGTRTRDLRRDRPAF